MHIINGPSVYYPTTLNAIHQTFPAVLLFLQQSLLCCLLSLHMDPLCSVMPLTLNTSTLLLLLMGKVLSPGCFTLPG
jgi:hypothetical protein